MLIDKIRRFLVENVLGLEDTERRIALGVALGWLIVFTPTLGVQVILYLVLAALLRANKVSGMPVIFLNTAFTAAPLYWLVWKVGALTLGTTGGEGAEIESLSALDVLFTGKGFFEGLGVVLTGSFWGHVGGTVVDLGAELWVGALVLGVATSVPFYFITVAAVRSFRRVKRESS